MGEAQAHGGNWPMFVAWAAKGNAVEAESFALAAQLNSTTDRAWAIQTQVSANNHREAGWQALLLGLKMAIREGAPGINLYLDSPTLAQALATKDPNHNPKYALLHQQVIGLSQQFDQVIWGLIARESNPARVVARREVTQQEFLVRATMVLQDRLCVKAGNPWQAASAAYYSIWPLVESAVENEALDLFHWELQGVGRIGPEEFEAVVNFSLDAKLYVRAEDTKSAESLAGESVTRLEEIPERYGLTKITGVYLADPIVIP